MLYHKKKLGEELGLPTFNHYYNIPITSLEYNLKNLGSSDTYIITFKQDNNLFVVDIGHQLGHTSHFDTVSLFEQDKLLSGIAAVPLASVHSIQILSFPDKLHSLNPSQRLKNLVALYYKNEEIMRYLKTTKNIGDQVTRYQLEAGRLERQGKDYDFFKYASRGKIREEDGISEVSSKDYDFISDFHPFLTSSRSQQVLSVPVTYFDDKTKQTARIDIMGWYIKDQQLKIRWKPKYMRKRRWRSSRISIDIVTDNYFFQGQIYRDSSAPVFLNNLSFDSKIPKSFLLHLQKQYQIFMALVEEQKRLALLRKVQLNNKD
ncbi:hypothetical protein [Streptococcus vestibularis]|uniref:hypothetical protein n=1 Tax=Streptococcus vestibularis TaxID=1343 RepID=UPI0026DF3940|nr:hypothetical protein [Streptococcus vestibularis]